MKLFTTQIVVNGPEGDPVWADQIMVDPALGLLAVAFATPGNSNARAAIRLTLGAVHRHIAHHADLLKRFRRTPVPELHKEVMGVLSAAYTRAATEVYAFARRYPGLWVALDAVLLVTHEAFVAHLGHGRVYLVRRGLVHQLTTDLPDPSEPEDSFDLLSDKHTTPSGVMGPEPRVDVETLSMKLLPEDRFVLLSSSVHQRVPSSMLHTELKKVSLPNLEGALAQALKGRSGIAVAGQLGSEDPPAEHEGRARMAVLAPMRLFQHCTEVELRAIAAATKPRDIPAGALLFADGDPGTELFLILSGHIRIEKHGNPITTLGPGSTLGEMALLDNPNRSATAIAIEPSELLVIDRDAFFRLMRSSAPMAVKILWNMLLTLSAHLRSTSKQLADAEDAREL